MHRRTFMIGGMTAAGWATSLRRTSLAQERGVQSIAAAAVHPLATQAAIEAMAAGGNAIDAAIACALVLGVVDGHNSGIGGGCLILARVSNGQIVAIDGRETAGAAAHAEMFVRQGVADPTLSQTGPLASGVPGQIAAMHVLHTAHGKLPWKQLFAWAIRHADSGHPASRSVARTLAAEAQNLARFPASRAIYLHADGTSIREGETLLQKDLAKTLTAISEEGPRWFYEGTFAQACCESLASLGGSLTLDDFRQYAAVHRNPIEAVYRGYRVLGFPPPSSGGMHIAQMLTMLEPYPVAQWYREQRSLYCHLLAEVMKRAFADRAFWLGDSDFVDVPSGLLDVAYNRERIKDFQESKASPGIEHGTPPGSRIDGRIVDPMPTDGTDGKHTTHLTTADHDGNWVAMTNTVNTSWGSKVTVPGTGVMLNNEMDDFSIAPGIPNAFGLVGSQANAVGPRKRPLSSMSPTLVLDMAGQPVMTCGAAGGPRIINATLQTLIRVLDLQQPIQTAIDAPRLHHQWRPDQLVVEDAIGNGTPLEITLEHRQHLEAMGHVVKTVGSQAVAQGIQRVGDRLVAAHDQRAQGASISRMR